MESFNVLGKRGDIKAGDSIKVIYLPNTKDAIIEKENK